MRPAAAPHNSVVALPDRGERSGGPLNEVAANAMSRTDRPSASCWRGHPVDTTTTAATPSAAIPATALGLPPSDPADVHHGVGLSPLHDPTALAEGRILDEVAVEVDPRLLSARGFARGLQGQPGPRLLRLRPAAEPALEDRDEIVGPGH